MLLGLEGERVDVDAGVAGDGVVVLVGLDQVEVGTIAGGEPVVAVELELASGHLVLANPLGLGVNLGGGGGEAIGVDVVEPVVRGARAGERAALEDPDQLLDGVVEVQLDAVGTRADSLRAGELELLDEVLVR